MKHRLYTAILGAACMVMLITCINLVSAQSIPVPAWAGLDPDVSAAVSQYPEAVIPALNTTALAVQAELTALGSDTDIAEDAALSVRAAGKAQACRNIRAALTADSSALQDVAFLEALRISEPEQMLTIYPEGRGLWVYYVEPSPNTGNAYWYTRQWWEVVRTRYTATDRVELKKTERMNASSILSIDDLRNSTMWTEEQP